MAIIQLLKRTARPVVCLALLSASTWSFGAVAVPQITQNVNNQQRVTLKGNVRPMPKRARDLGAVDVSAPASRVLLLLKRPAEQEAQLEQFIAEAHTPGTASYRHWLTPTQLGNQFGPADSDVQAVVAWLQSQGLAVAKVSAAKTTIEFSGTAGQIESAFATKIHSFQIDGVTHISNVTDPQIPAALAPVIAGISPLNDFRPKPMHTVPQSRSAIPAPTSANPNAMTVAPATLRPDLTVPNGNGGNDYFLTPADAATIYDTPNTSLNKNHGSLNLLGTGVSIGIAGDSNVDGLGTGSNVANYRSLFKLPALPSGSSVVIDGNDPGTGSDDEVEALLDLEVASAIAPGAKLTLYTAQDTSFASGLFLAIQRALDDNQVSILNVSFGSCEAFNGQSGNLQVLNYWEQAAAQGISVTVSTGDSGSAGCDDANTESSALYGLQVNGLASTPFNIAVGGTDFNQSASNESTYWSPTNLANGGSALSHIPEIPWNDSTSTIGSLSGNVPTSIGGSTLISGAGGGFSNCLNATLDDEGNIAACPNSAQAPGFYAKPTWQSSFGTQNARQLPDVSLFAADGLHDSAWVLCASGLGQSNGTDCVVASGSYSFLTVGGTSASSPAFAGMLALVTQQIGANTRLGQADFNLYPLATQYAASFHDVTTGNNAVYCLSGAPNCGANGFLTGYNAAAGYDLGSGLGSVDATLLVQNWSKVTFKASSTALTVNGSTAAVSIQHGAPVSVGVTVTGTGGTPSGNVALIASGGNAASATLPVQGTTASPSILTLANGTATNPAYPYLPGGSYSLTANYGGDGIFAPSVSTPPISVTVSAEPSTLVLEAAVFPTNNGPAVPAGTVPYGTYVSVSAQPFSTAQLAATNVPYFDQATGTVTFTSGSTYLNKPNIPVGSNGIAEIPGQTNLAYPPGIYSVAASYSGDPSFSASTAAAQTFTVTKDSVAITATNGTTAGTAVVEVEPVGTSFFFNSGATQPTGTVTVTNASGATVGSGPLAAGTDPTTGAPAAFATITFTGTATAVNYPGDTNYTSGTVAFSGNGGSGSFTLSAAPASITVPSGGSSSTTMNVTPQGGFTGTVKMTCTVTGGATCSLASGSITVSGTAAVADKLTVTAPASSALHIPANPSRSTWYAAGGAAFAGILLIGLPGRRRAWQRMLSLMLLVVAIGVVGCGGTSSNNGNTTDTVTVTATSGSTTQTTTVTATVQ